MHVQPLLLWIMPLGISNDKKPSDLPEYLGVVALLKVLRVLKNSANILVAGPVSMVPASCVHLSNQCLPGFSRSNIAWTW